MLDRGKPACQRLIIYTFFIPEGLDGLMGDGCWASPAAPPRVSQNIYWQGSAESRLQKLNSLAPQSLTVRAHAVQQDGETVVSVQLENPGSEPALAAKLTHEPRTVDIRCSGCGRSLRPHPGSWLECPSGRCPLRMRTDATVQHHPLHRPLPAAALSASGSAAKQTD
jgi:Exo-beta-D-glucosaminidase Ig-fold domain